MIKTISPEQTIKSVRPQHDWAKEGFNYTSLGGSAQAVGSKNGFKEPRLPKVAGFLIFWNLKEKELTSFQVNVKTVSSDGSSENRERVTKGREKQGHNLEAFLRF